MLLFIGELENFYTGSFTIYDRCQSTTKRPEFGGGPPFFLIRLTDPHLHCFPSLHVIIASFTVFKISSIMGKFAEGKDTYQAEMDHLFTMAVRIINSMLFVKQYSVDCVPAGLFMLQGRIPEFTSKYSDMLLDNILQVPEIPVENREEIASYMKTLLGWFSNQQENKASSEVLNDFLLNYPRTNS